VNHAYEVLGDAKKRQLFDEFGEEGLREGFDPERVRAYKDWSSRQGRRSGGRTEDAGRAVDLEDLFGGSAGGGVGDLFGDLMGRARRSRGPANGRARDCPYPARSDRRQSGARRSARRALVHRGPSRRLGALGPRDSACSLSA
jgi:DnaJ-class molecular chaperone